MADSPPGRQLTARFRLPTGLTAETTTVEALDCLTNTPVAISPLAEAPAASGRYIATVDGVALPSPTRLRVTLREAGIAWATQHYEVGPIGPRQVTRPLVRRRIIGRLYDEEALEAPVCTVITGNADGATAEPLVIGGVNEFRGHWLWFQDGLNMFQERLATSYDVPTRRIGWQPALPSVPQAGDHFELGPLRGSTLNQAIDDVLEELRDQWLRPAADATLVTDGTASEWRLPDDFRVVARVALLDDATAALVQWLAPGQWVLGPNRTLRMTNYGGSLEPDPMDWGVERGTAPLPAGLRLRLEGYVSPPQIVDDAQLIDCPIDALIDAAVLMLAQGMERHRPVLPFMAQRANRSRALAVTRVGPVAREVVA